MVPRLDRLFTAALIPVAVIGIGCSDRGTKPTSTNQEATRAVPTTFTPDEGAASPSAPAVVPSGPVTFSDGEKAYEAKNYTEATRVFGRYTEDRPDNAWGHFMLGLASWKGGDLTKAESAFESALRIDPDHVKSLVNLSRVLLDAKRPADALVKLTRAAELEPMSADVQRLLGRTHQAQGMTEDAIVAYQRAIELDEKDSWSMNNLGLLYLEEGKAADAVPLLTKATELRADVAAFHNNLGMALEHTGSFRDAAAAYTSALKADPGYEKARKNLARVELVKEKPKAADEPKAAEPKAPAKPGGGIEPHDDEGGDK
jgi:Flp pilus assembly protein TadD